MGVACCGGETVHESDKRYRKILWIALGANLVMFFLEIISAWHAGSTSLFADAMDFMADSANYAITLYALALTAEARSHIAMAKGYTMALYGLVILLTVLLNPLSAHPPIASIMGVIALLALLVNFGVAWLLFHFRSGDSNRHAVWLCTRNDAIANVAVLLAALGVWLTHSRWPDMVVGLSMGLLGLWSGRKIIIQAKAELTLPAISPKA